MIGARLKQARLLAGMTLKEFATALGESDYRLTAAAISKYEIGKSQPPADYLLLASSILKVPVTYFTHHPEKLVEWFAFRCRKRLSQKERNRIKAYAADVAELQVELRELLYPQFVPTLPRIPVATSEDAEHAAEQLRLTWEVGDRPLDNLVQIAEDRGVIVVDWYDDTGLFDGLSGVCDRHPIAVIKTNVPADRKRLSLAHEIGHLVMNVEDTAKTREEELAYRFAAALLAPAEHAFHELSDWRKRLSWIELKSLKRKYGMSMSAWIRRARDLRMISSFTYKTMNRDIRLHGWHRDEPGNYFGDEKPLLLEQMAARAVAEGLISPDRIARIGSGVLDNENLDLRKGEYPDALALLEMDDDKRDMWMSKMFDLAQNMEFEIFEAYGEEDFGTWD